MALSSPQTIALATVKGLSARYGWTEVDRAAVDLAITSADPAGFDSRASAPEWWEAIREGLQAIDYPPPGLDRLIQVATSGAAGARPMSVADQARDFAGGVASDVAAAAEGVRDVASKGKDWVIPGLIGAALIAMLTS